MNEEFTDDQLGRLDHIEEAAREFLNKLAYTDDVAQDLDDIWSIIYKGARLLTKRGIRVWLPACVTDEDGNEHITDWFEEDIQDGQT